MAEGPNPMSPVAHTVSQEITEKLMRRIVDREYLPGTKLPTERELALEFEVTRHVVREALKRLEAVGLVRIRQGSGIYVENLQLTGGLELFEVLLKRQDGSINLAFLKDVLEFRGHLFREVARLAATRRTDDEFSQMRRLLHERREHANVPGRVEEINLSLFQLITRATHNQIYELLFNTLGRLSVRLGVLIDIPLLGFEQTQRMFERVMEAFEHQDDAMADLLVARYLESVREALEAKLGGLPTNES